MKTSIDLPDELYRRVKSKSALEGRAVREVATALFAAWVDGRVPADMTPDPAAGADAPQEQWLARWKQLASTVTEVTAGNSGLVDQLRNDRK